MKTIVAGSRTITDINLVRAAMLEAPWEITEVVSGTAKGVDTLGEEVAKEFGLPITRYPAQWKVHGVFDKAAGYKRNVLMSENAEALIALHSNNSRGTAHMIKIAIDAGLKVFVKVV